MKKYLPKKIIVFIIIIWTFTYISGASLAEETADKNKAPENNTETVVANVGRKCFICEIIRQREDSPCRLPAAGH
jgi:hypothetical protein